MKTFLALLCCISIPAFASDWSSADTKREVAFDALLAVDWSQTQWFIKHPCNNGTHICSDPRHELNPLLGEHPSSDRVTIAVLTTGILHYAISKALPRDWRTGWQYISIGVEGGVVVHNFHIGIKMDFLNLF